MAFDATLKYTFAPGLQTPAALAAQVAAVVPSSPNDGFDGELLQLGMFLKTDVTAVVGGLVERTIGLRTLPLGDTLWLTAEEVAYATRNLYTQLISARVPAICFADLPVVV